MVRRIRQARAPDPAAAGRSPPHGDLLAGSVTGSVRVARDRCRPERAPAYGGRADGARRSGRATRRAPSWPPPGASSPPPPAAPPHAPGVPAGLLRPADALARARVTRSRRRRRRAAAHGDPLAPRGLRPPPGAARPPPAAGSRRAAVGPARPRRGGAARRRSPPGPRPRPPAAGLRPRPPAPGRSSGARPSGHRWAAARRTGQPLRRLPPGRADAPPSTPGVPPTEPPSGPPAPTEGSTLLSRRLAFPSGSPQPPAEGGVRSRPPCPGRRRPRKTRTRRPYAPPKLQLGRSTRGLTGSRAILYAMRPYEGLLTAMITPFRADGSVDEEGAVAIGRHLSRRTDRHGLVVAGTTGEAATMTDEEHLGLIALIASELGEEGTVVGGTGSNDTRHAVHLTEQAVGAGVDAVLSVHAVLQQAEPPRDHRPLQGSGEGGGRHTGDPLQHPGPERGQHAARSARRAGADRRDRGRQAGQQR